MSADIIEFPTEAIYRVVPTQELDDASAHDEWIDEREHALREIALAGDLLGYLLPPHLRTAHGVGQQRRAEAEAARSDGGFYKKRLMTMRQLQRALAALIEREEAAWKQARAKKA